MKKLLLAVFSVSAALAASQADAQPYSFRAEAQCWFNQAEGYCRVYNTLPMPIYCQGIVQGMTYSGYYATVNFRSVIQPGQYANAWVQANNPYADPLVDVGGNISCQTL